MHRSTPEELPPGLKLNLGSGPNPLEGFVNVDVSGSPDVKCDLEQFPWPWDDNSASEIVMTHVLEHLGATSQAFFKIIRELYRISRHDAMLRVTVPHPRSDFFINDPTHVRPITPEIWMLFSKKLNRECKEAKASNSPLAEYLDVDFEVVNVRFDLHEPWARKLQENQITREQLIDAGMSFNNVVQQIYMEIKVIKPTGATL